MAENNIKFKIGTEYNGEGFDKLNGAIKESKKELNSFKTGLGDVKSAFQGLSPEMSTATEKLGLFVGAFTTGGIVGGTIRLAMDGLAEGIKIVGDKIAEAKEKTEQWATILKDRLVSSISEAKNETSSLSGEVNQLNADMKDALAVLNGDVAREAKNKVNELHVDTLNSITEDMSESAQNIIVALEKVKSTTIMCDAAIEQHKNTVEAISELLAKLKDRENAMGEQLNAAREKYKDLLEQSNDYLTKKKTLDDALANAEERYKNGTSDLATVIGERKQHALKIAELETEYAPTIKKLNESEKAIADIEKNIADIQKEYAKNLERRETAELDLEAAVKERAAKLADANAQVDKEYKAAEKLVDAQNKLSQDFDSFLNDQLNKLNDSTGYLADTSTFLADMEKALAGDIDDVRDSKGNGTEKDKPRPVEVKNPDDFPGHGGMEVKSNDDMAGIRKPRKLDNEVWERFVNKRASVEDRLAVKRFQKLEERYGKTEMFAIYRDTRKWLQMLDSSKKLNPQEKTFKDIFEKEVLPSLPPDLVQEMIGDSSQKLLTSKRMDTALEKVLKKGNKSVADIIETMNDMMGKSLTIR